MSDPVRHLAFHVYPAAGSGVWRLALDQLALRRHLFTGTRAVAVATGPGLDPWGEVADYVAEVLGRADVFPVPNDPGLREVATWRPLWDRVLAAAADGDVAFYAHAKGATRPVDPGNSCHWWASLLYAVCLDHWPLVARQLAAHPITGAAKKVGRGFGRGCGDWHYSGTFYWVRAGDFRRHRYVVPPPAAWWGTEAWPGLAYPAGEAGCLFLQGRVPTLDLYSRGYWDRVVRPEYHRWILERRAEWESTPPGS